jgi:heme exporter protein D
MHMAQKPVIGGIIVGALLLPTAINLATNAFPEGWSRYNWVAIPASCLLVGYLIIDALRAKRDSTELQSPETESERERRLRAWRQERQPVYSRLKSSTGHLEDALMAIYGRLSEFDSTSDAAFWENQSSPVSNRSPETFLAGLDTALQEVQQEVSELSWGSTPVPIAVRQRAEVLVELARVLYICCDAGYVLEADKRLSWYENVDAWRKHRLSLRELLRDDLQSPIPAGLQPSTT